MPQSGSRSIMPVAALSSSWEVLGPFQIGTREATWGADPLEQYGGFRKLSFLADSTFVSSLAPNGRVGWSNHQSTTCTADEHGIEAAISFSFHSIDWAALQRIYGWSSIQYQAWGRTHVDINSTEPQTLVVYIDNVLEFYVDSQHYFGGDYYAFRKAPVVLRLSPGRHRLDVRLIRDNRSMGGDDTSIDLNIKMSLVTPGLYIDNSQTLIPDVVDGELASPYGSVTVRNHASEPLLIHKITGLGDASAVGLDLPKTIQPGQTRSLSIFLTATHNPIQTLDLAIWLQPAHPNALSSQVSVPTVRFNHCSSEQPFRLTYRQTSGTVGYTMVKAPVRRFWLSESNIPLMLNLHGAGLEADDPELTKSLDAAGDLPAFILYPTGGSAWSGDDWHQNGFTHVESSIVALREWASSWKGPKPRIDRMFLVGHSNGGQGTWYFLTHHADRVHAAAVASGYSSIQNYVPYQFWHPADPAIKSVLEGSLLCYRHELLLRNLKGIPLLIQHGDVDANVPCFHSRLMQQLARQADLDAKYHEVPGADHWFDGILTTKPLLDFYHTQLDVPKRSLRRELPVIVTSARPGSFGPTAGLEIKSLRTPGQLGVLTVTEDAITGALKIRTSNVTAFVVMGWQDHPCPGWTIDSQDFPSSEASAFRLTGNKWHSISLADLPYSAAPGGMDAFLRATRPLTIAKSSSDADMNRIALQISRNLYQHYSLDTTISDGGIEDTNTAIRLSIGGHMTLPRMHDSAESYGEAAGNSVVIHDERGIRHCYDDTRGSIGAIFLSQVSRNMGDSPGLAIWGSDGEGLAMAARLLPMLPGVGQPDFVIVDRETMVEGAAGCLALGFFTFDENAASSTWRVSSNAYFR